MKFNILISFNIWNRLLSKDIQIRSSPNAYRYTGSKPIHLLMFTQIYHPYTNGTKNIQVYMYFVSIFIMILNTFMIIIEVIIINSLLILSKDFWFPQEGFCKHDHQVAFPSFLSILRDSTLHSLHIHLQLRWFVNCKT